MSNMNVRGKRLLILGATQASFDVVKIAKEMGVITVVTDDDSSHPVRKIADEDYLVSTTDFIGLEKLIRGKNIDGVFCGPSEFNIKNLIKICGIVHFPCYATMEQWERCSNKNIFKQYCMNYGVDCPKEYNVNEFSSDKEINRLSYPVIVKPVDRCSSIGITVCKDSSAIRKACCVAREASLSKKIVVEKYIENQGKIFGVRYLLKDGEAYPYLFIDTYVVDPFNKNGLISAVTLTPSKYIEYYMNNMDSKVREMLKGIGLKNGTVFFQALPFGGKIYFHEMGFRLSGGFIYKMTQPLMEINDVKMMIGYALGEDIGKCGELSRINFQCQDKVGAQLMIPLSEGTIRKIEGMEEITEHPCVQDIIQYYSEGDTITQEYMGTLQQLFARFTLIADSKKELIDTMEFIQNRLIVRDDNGRLLTEMHFDMKRIE